MEKKYVSDNKRVILITGDNSQWYEQAIFIVKKNARDAMPSGDFVKEAEKIISSYLTGTSERTERLPDVIAASPAANRKTPPPLPEKKTSQNTNRSFGILLNSVLLTICVILAALVVGSIV